MSLEPCKKRIPKITRGEDKNLELKYINKVTKDPVDLSTATEIEAVFLNEDGTLLSKTLSTAGIVLISGAGGHIQIQISADESALLAPSAEASYSDIETNFIIAGKKSIVAFLASINVVSRRFPIA